MKFDLEKNNNRTLLDIGDTKAYFLYLSNTNKHLDRATLSVIVSILGYIEERFELTQPKEAFMTSIDIHEYYLNKQIKKIFKKNLKLLKKNRKNLIDTADFDNLDSIPAEDITFNKLQIKQFEEILNKAMKNITITIEEQPDDPQKKEKKEKKG